MSISTKRVQRMLRAEWPEAELSFTGGGHLRLRFPDGAVVYTASSPSRIHFMTFVRMDVRKARERSKQLAAGRR